MPRAGSDRSAGFVRRRRETGAGVCGRSHDAFALESASSDSRVAHGRSTKTAPGLRCAYPGPPCSRVSVTEKLTTLVCRSWVVPKGTLDERERKSVGEGKSV